MNNLTDIVTVYRNLSETNSEVLFEKGRLLREAIEAGADKDALLAECGKESGDSRAQVRKIYAVGMVFPPEVIAHDFDWWVHMVAATAPGVDIDRPATYTIADRWLKTAINGRDIKRGKKVTRAKHTARTLRKLIAGDRAGEKPQTIVKQMDAIVISANEWTDKLVLAIPDLDLNGWAALQWQKQECTTVTITITHNPQPATAPAVETHTLRTEAA